MMQWEQRRFDGTASLVAAADASIAEGLLHWVGRDGDEPALAWMDRLGQARSDWLPAIGGALVQLGLQGRDGSTAVADFLGTARIGPALLGSLDALLAAGADPRGSVRVNMYSMQGPLTLSQIRGPLAELAAGLSTPTWIYFECKPRRALEVGTLAQRREAVLDSISVGRRRTDSGFDLFTLGWLRYLAFFAPALRPELSEHLRALAQGDDPRGWFCLAEYLGAACDVHWVAALLAELCTTRPPWADLRFGIDEPTGWPVRGHQYYVLKPGLHDNPTLGAMIEHAAGRAREELRTAPQDVISPHHP